MSTRVSASRLRVPTPVLDTDAANKAYADSKLTKLAVGQNTQIYARNGAGVDTGIGYSGNPLANTIPIRDAGGRIAVEDPTAIGHAATKNYVDTTTPKIADGAVISGPNNLSGALGTWAPESSGFIHLPHLFNDLAYNIIRGGAITITQNGNPIASANIPKVFEPNTTALSIALVDKATDVFVVEVDTCVAFRYGTQVGIAMPSGFRGKNVVIEGWYNDVWNPITTRSSVETGLVIQAISVPTSATTPMTRLRYTIRDFHSSASFRISSIFAMAYNSPLLEQGFVSRAGGDLYGPLYTPADPTRSDELARKNYVDTKLAKRGGGYLVYTNDADGNPSSIAYSSGAGAMTLMLRTANGVTSVGDPTADSHAANKLYVDTQLLGKVGTGDSRLTDARPPLAHTHASADITSGANITAGNNVSTSSIAGAITAFQMPNVEGKAAVVGAKISDLVNAQGSGSYAPNWKSASNGTSRSVADATSSFGLDMWVGGSRYVELQFACLPGFAVKVWIDGMPYTDLPVSPTWTAGVVNTLKIDLGGADKPRRVRVMVDKCAIGSVWVEANGVTWAPQLRGSRVLALADSLTQGTAFNTGGELGTWLPRFADHCNLGDYWNGGILGTGPTVGYNGFPNFQVRATQDVVPTDAKLILVGTWFNGRENGASANATAITNIISTLKGMASKPTIVVFGPPDPAGVNTTQALVDVDTAVRNACTTAGVAYISPLTGDVYAGTGTRLLDGDPWINAANRTALIASDNVHFTDQGHKVFGSRMAEAYSLIAANVVVTPTVAWADVTGKPATFAPTIGSTATTAVAGNDPRLTDARTPTTHVHTVSQLSDASTVAKSALVAADAPTFRSVIGAGTSSLAIGTTASTAAAGNDARLSDARVPLDNSVTNVKIPVGAAIDPTKLGTGRVIAMDGSGALLSITKQYMSQAQYDALATKDPNFEYNII